MDKKLEEKCEKYRSSFDHYDDPDREYRLFLRGYKRGVEEVGVPF